jgi:hypothetical protein
MSTVIISAIGGVVAYVATLVVTLPTRAANWDIRRQGLELDLERIEAARDDAVSEAERTEAQTRRGLLGPGTSAVLHGSPTHHQLKDAEARREREVETIRRDAELRCREAQKELDARWWTHMFADRCQGGHQPAVFRSTFPGHAVRDDAEPRS